MIPLTPSEQAILRSLVSRRTQLLTNAERDLESIQIASAIIIARAGGDPAQNYTLNPDQTALVPQSAE